jgi:hypothetical protein
VEKTRSDRISNTHIRGELKMEEIQNQIDESRLRWSGHVKSVDEYRMPKKIIGTEDEWKKTQRQTMHTKLREL